MMQKSKRKSRLLTYRHSRYKMPTNDLLNEVDSMGQKHERDLFFIVSNCVMWRGTWVAQVG